MGTALRCEGIHNPYSEQRDLTVDDLKTFPEDLRYELLNGKLVLLNPHVDEILRVEVFLALRAGCPSGRVAVVESPIRNAGCEPYADVTVVSPGYRVARPVSVEKALLVVEILPEEDLGARMFYAAAGVEHYWALAVDDEVRLTQYRRGPGGDYEMLLSTPSVFETRVPFRTVLDLPALTGQRRARLAGIG
jgi:Uma2 family endonuclease